MKSGSILDRFQESVADLFTRSGSEIERCFEAKYGRKLKSEEWYKAADIVQGNRVMAGLLVTAVPLFAFALSASTAVLSAAVIAAATVVCGLALKYIATLIARGNSRAARKGKQIFADRSVTRQVASSARLHYALTHG